MSGTKLDQDKPDMALLPFDSLVEVSKVLIFGAKKYGRDNWKEVQDGEHRFLSAMLRHIAEVQAGNEMDSETGLSHYSHIATNALFILHFHLSEISKNEESKMPKNGHHDLCGKG